MKTSEQLKGAVRNLAKEKGLHTQEVLQNFMFERIIERLSMSSYKEIFILKGGLLISAMLGIQERTTMDMDTTVKGLHMEEQNIWEALIEILGQPVEDGVQFELINLKPIREDDEYENFRASLQAMYGKMKIPMRIDITTGDEIIPREIQFSYPLLFEDKRVPVMAYTMETILAEKYETIIRRNIGNTRARDFYDPHLLYQLYQQHADWCLLKRAVLATAKKRKSVERLYDAERILPALEDSVTLQQLWKRYQEQNLYARGIKYSELIETVREFTENITVNEDRIA